MYREILVPVDNSELSDCAVARAVITSMGSVMVVMVAVVMGSRLFG